MAFSPTPSFTSFYLSEHPCHQNGNKILQKSSQSRETKLFATTHTHLPLHSKHTLSPTFYTQTFSHSIHICLEAYLENIRLVQDICTYVENKSCR